jgi:hypothetical protein
MTGVVPAVFIFYPTENTIRIFFKEQSVTKLKAAPTQKYDAIIAGHI